MSSTCLELAASAELRDTRDQVRSLIGLVAIACFAAQAVAISKSATPGKSPVHCVVWPLGDCEMVLASGYGSIIGPELRATNLDGALAILVPLTMWIGIILSSHNPVFWTRTEGKKKLSPGAWAYLLIYAALLLWAGSRLNL